VNAGYGTQTQWWRGDTCCSSCCRVASSGRATSLPAPRSTLLSLLSLSPPRRLRLAAGRDTRLHSRSFLILPAIHPAAHSYIAHVPRSPFTQPSFDMLATMNDVGCIAVVQSTAASLVVPAASYLCRTRLRTAACTKAVPQPSPPTPPPQPLLAARAPWALQVLLMPT
jgi:hypothetical protein